MLEGGRKQEIGARRSWRAVPTSSVMYLRARAVRRSMSGRLTRWHA